MKKWHECATNEERALVLAHCLPSVEGNFSKTVLFLEDVLNAIEELSAKEKKQKE